MQTEKVPYFILDLLQQVPSVYVKGLGRFDAIFHSATIGSGQIQPPYVEPGFMAGSMNEKEILSAFIHYVTGADPDEADHMIREFVSRVHQHVDSGDPYTIEKFGTFSKSETDVIHFTPDWDAFNLSFIGLEILDLYPPAEHKPDKAVSHVTESVPEPSASSFTVAPEVTGETNWVTDREAAETDKESEIILPPVAPAITERTSKMWWSILAGALIMITLLCGYLAWDIISNRDKVNQYIAISNDTLATATPDIEIVDTLEFIEEPLPTDSPVVTEPPKDTIAPEPTAPPCFVVVGAFANSGNVVRMEERLKSLGYQSELIKGGSLTRVAIKTDCEKTSLQKTLNEARSGINPEAWIY